MTDAVNHPSHYAEVVPGIECIQVSQHFNFNRGNAIKYLWRAGAKGDAIEDLRKAIRYCEFEIERLETERAQMRQDLLDQVPGVEFPGLAQTDPTYHTFTVIDGPTGEHKEISVIYPPGRS